MNACRPYAHYDIENHFTSERIALTPMPNVPAHGRRAKPVMWAYPANNFDYATQNRFGEPSGGRGSSGGVQLGPFRIVTDRHQTIQGMAYHPRGNPTRLDRAQERRGRLR